MCLLCRLVPGRWGRYFGHWSAGFGAWNSCRVDYLGWHLIVLRVQFDLCSGKPPATGAANGHVCNGATLEEEGLVCGLEYLQCYDAWAVDAVYIGLDDELQGFASWTGLFKMGELLLTWNKNTELAVRGCTLRNSTVRIFLCLSMSEQQKPICTLALWGLVSLGILDGTHMGTAFVERCPDTNSMAVQVKLSFYLETFQHSDFCILATMSVL